MEFRFFNFDRRRFFARSANNGLTPELRDARSAAGQLLAQPSSWHDACRAFFSSDLLGRFGESPLMGNYDVFGLSVCKKSGKKLFRCELPLGRL